MTAPASPSAEYVSDVPYPRNFVPQLSPAMMRLAAAMGGHAPPSGDDFDYCELGAGRGDTLVTLAAANPDARFVGVDLVAEHVAFARALAAGGQLKNVRVTEGDFEDDALVSGLPAFDYVVAHGVLSWVSPLKRAALFRFAKAKLKPNGLLLVSYNALPGWAAIEPLRRLVVERANRTSGGSLERARAGLDLARRLADAKAGYFVANPNAQKMLEVMKEGGLEYVVHEHLHAHWHAMHVADVAREAASEGLAYAGRMPLYLNVNDLAFPPGVKEIAAGESDPIALEGLKDLASNELFRTDVYARAEAAPDPKETRRFFEQTPFGAITTEQHFKRAARLPVYTVDFAGPVYGALVPRLSAEPCSAVELAVKKELAGLGRDRIGQAFMNLCLGGQVFPMRRRGAMPARSPRLGVPSAFNRAALVQATEGDGPLALASIATDTGVTLSLLEAIFLRLLTEVEPPGRAAWVREHVPARLFPITVGARTLADHGALVETALRDVDAYAASVGPKLCQLGILEPLA